MLNFDIVARVMSRLQLPAAPAGTAGLADVYRAWCGAVPFDNVQKRVWLAERRGPMPGNDPVAFFEDWLVHGTGGTCWGSSGALCALLRALGFDARRATGAMMIGEGFPAEDRRGTHGTVLCDVDGETFLLDTHVLTGVPLHYRRGEETSFAGVGWARLAPDASADGAMRLAFDTIGGLAGLSCLIEDERASDAFCTAQHLRSETESGFNLRTVVRRRDGLGMVVVSAGLHRVARNDDVRMTSVIDREARDTVLRALGYSDAIVERLPPDAPPA